MADLRAGSVWQEARTKLEAAQQLLSDTSTTFKKLEAELKTSKTFNWKRVESLRSLRKALSEPDLSTPAGISNFERLTTGDIQESKGLGEVVNPPLLRLLEIGFFNPDYPFDLAFFKEMAHSGFWPGASWLPENVDSMHFELVEGRDKIIQKFHQL